MDNENGPKGSRYLVEEEDEIDGKGHKQSQHPHVVEIPGKVVLNGRATRRTGHYRTALVLKGRATRRTGH